ncbi:MAG: threonine/serine exporter family protein [Candidatus Ornithospirochaeta sp.]
MERKENRDVNAVLETSMKAGRIMLENGAEIFRVEDTMKRIAAAYGVEDENFFVLSNGIFTTGTEENGKSSFAKVEHIPVHGADLSKVAAINQLSREICCEKHTLSEASRILDEIRRRKSTPPALQVFATALGAGCFALLLDGTVWDGLSAFAAGIVLGFFVVYVSSKYLSKITGNLLGGAIVTIVCILASSVTTVPSNMMSMIGGSIIPLVPGVAFVNGIRDIGDGDYISGAVRLLDAILVFICIAAGVGIVLGIYAFFNGGKMI